MDTRQIVRDVEKTLDDTLKIIIDNMAKNSENATGKTKDSFAVVIDKNTLRLVFGDKGAPLESLEKGHEPNSVPKGFMQIIENWSRAKGISFATETERRSFAFLTARKIYREGTLRYKKNIDIYSEPVKRANKAILESVEQDISKFVKTGLNSLK